MNEITRYHNQLNTVPMRNWSPEEQNFFFAIITQARDKKDDVLVFNKENLTEFADYTLQHKKRFKDTIDSLVLKLRNIWYEEEYGNTQEEMALFQRFKRTWNDDYSDLTLEVQVSSHFEYILNKLDANFTQFELKQFTKLRSSYAKEMFKKLKQWRTIGKRQYSTEEFREMLQIPKSYRATDIKKVVLKPITEELSEYFVGLKVNLIKSNRQGSPIIAYEFTWQPEKVGTWIDGKYNGKEPRDVTKSKKKIRKETLPDWAEDGYVAPKQQPVSLKEDFGFSLRLYNYPQTKEAQREIIDNFNKRHGEGTFEDLLASEVKEK